MFSDATFAGQAYPNDVAAESGLAFTGASISGRAFLESITTPNLDLTQAVFTQRATVYVSGGCVADHARFDDGVDVRLRQRSTSVSILSLAGVRLGASSTFTGDIPRTAPGSAESTRLPQLLSLAGADVAELTIIDIDIDIGLFAGAINLDKVRMGGTNLVRPARPRPSVTWSRTREIMLAIDLSAGLAVVFPRQPASRPRDAAGGTGRTHRVRCSAGPGPRHT